MATARHAMLAAVRGRFGEAARLAGQVAADCTRAGLPDTERLVAALYGHIAFYQGPEQAPFTVDQLTALARRLPRHFMEATVAADARRRAAPGRRAGRAPRRAAADAERARVNVTRTIRAAIDRITGAAPIAGAHLQASIRTGTACRYQPAAGGPARWHT